MVRFVDIKEKERNQNWIEVDLLDSKVQFLCLDLDVNSFEVQKITFDSLRFEKDRSAEGLKQLEFEKSWNINKNILMNCVIDWKNIEDEDDNELPFSKELLSILFDQYKHLVNQLSSKLNAVDLLEDQATEKKQLNA